MSDVAEVVKVTNGGRMKRYAVSYRKWLRKLLTYKVTKYSVKIPDTEVDQAAVKSFKVKYDECTRTVRRTFIVYCISEFYLLNTLLLIIILFKLYKVFFM